MIAEHELSQWVGDPERYRQSEVAINAFAKSWNQGRSNRRIAATIAAVGADPSAEQLAGAVAGLFDDDSWTRDLISALSEAMKGDPFFVPPFRQINSDVHQGLVIYEDELLSIAAGVSGAGQLAAKKNVARGATSIGFSGQVGVLKFVKAGGCRVSFWEAPLITANFSAADAGVCRKVAERTIVDGETLVVDGRFQSFVIEHARANLVLLQATLKPDQAPLSVEYDSVSRAFVGCSAADDSASRIQMITTLLRKLEAVEAFPVIAEFLDNPNFYVRWHVMRELLGLDAVKALPFVERMAGDDAHVENRRAARSVLATVAAQSAEHRAAA